MPLNNVITRAIGDKSRFRLQFFLIFLGSICYVISVAWALISQLLSNVKRFFIFSYVYCLCACEQDGTLIIF